MKFPRFWRRETPAAPSSVPRSTRNTDVGQSLSGLLLGGLDPVPGVTRSEQNRYVGVRQQIRVLRSLYESDGYAAQIVRNIIAFAVGEGIHVEFGSDAIQRMWDGWNWSRLNPMATPVELDEEILRNSIRDGMFLGEFRYPMAGDGDLKIDVVDGLSIWRTAGAGVQAGVQTDDQGITGFHFEPYLRYIGDIEQAGYRWIPASSAIYTFHTEYPNQVRGLSWMRQAITPLLALAQFDKDLGEGITRAVRDRGYWEIEEMAMEPIMAALSSIDVPEGTTEEERMTMEVARGEAIRRLFDRVRWEDIDTVPWMPAGVKWVNTPVAGVTDVEMSRNQRDQMIDRIGVSVGLTRQALTDPSGRNIPIARIDYTKDLRYYQRCQRYTMAPKAKIVDAWAAHWCEMSSAFNRLYEGYEFRPAPFPYLDALRDAQALGRLLKMGVTTPQRIIRDRGMSVEAVQEEISDWMGWLSEMLGQHGFTLGEYEQVAEADEDARQSEDSRFRD